MKEVFEAIQQEVDIWDQERKLTRRLWRQHRWASGTSTTLAGLLSVCWSLDYWPPGGTYVLLASVILSTITATRADQAEKVLWLRFPRPMDCIARVMLAKERERKSQP